MEYQKELAAVFKEFLTVVLKSIMKEIMEEYQKTNPETYLTVKEAAVKTNGRLYIQSVVVAFSRVCNKSIQNRSLYYYSLTSSRIV